MRRKISLPLILLVMMTTVWILGACGGSQGALAPTLAPPTPASTPTEPLTPEAKPSAPTEAPTPEASPTSTLEPTATPLPAVDGQALVQERCTVCHSLDRVRQSRKTEAEWRTTVERMARKGAALSADELEAVIRYLATAYPK